MSRGCWWVLHSKATIHPSTSHSVSLSTRIHHHLAYLNPFFQLSQSLFPPPVLPRVGSIKGCHGNDVMLSGEGRGDWRVIDPVWWRCDVTPCFLLESVIVGICHVRVTFSSPPLLPALFCPLPFFFLQPRHAIKLLSVLNQMPQRHGPDTFFNFPGRSAAVSLNMLQMCKTRLVVLMKKRSNLCQHLKINLPSMQQWTGWLASVLDLVVFQFRLSDSYNCDMKRLAGVGGCSHLVSVCREVGTCSL